MGRFINADAFASTGQGLLGHNMFIYCNNNSIVFRMNARENDKKMLILCKEHNVPIVIGSDAHAVGKVGEKSNALELVEEVDFPEELIMNYYPDKLKEYLSKN